MDGTELDEIMNGSDEPEVIATPSEPATQPETNAQPRDESGKFAPKAAAEPEQVEPPQLETEEEPETGHVPQKALHEERKKRQTAEQENNDLRRQMQEMQGQIRLLSERAMQPAQPQPPKEQAPAPQLWEDPNGFISNALTPIQEQVQQQFLQTSELLAIEKHGEDAVSAAGQAMLELAKSGDPAVAAEYQRIMSARHPYGELVSWHARHKAMQEIGNDPNAYRERLRQELLAEMGHSPAAIPANPAPSGTKPLTQLPKSLNRLPGGGNAAAEVDASDAGLFAHAMGR